MKIGSFVGPAFFETQEAARAELEREYRSIGIVRRDRLRGVVFHCPCGCGDTLVMNLDKRAGQAWRLRLHAEGVTLLPSVWRVTGCRSHFIIWKSGVLWCDFDDDDSDWPLDLDAELKQEWVELRRNRGV